jgi:hypothetical protein
MQALAGAALFGIAGYAFGPVGALIGEAIGAAFGEKQNPDRRKSQSLLALTVSRFILF